jgi:hypothetical protein
MTDSTIESSQVVPTLLLGHNADWWNTWLLVALVVAAGAAIFVAIFTTGVILVQRQDGAALSLAVADANERAAKATNEAARLGVKVDALPAFVSEKERQVNALAEEMRKSSAELDAARIAAQTSQAKAEAALTTFRKEAGSRSLDAQTRARFVEALRGKMKVPVFVRSVANDRESFTYAEQWLQALKSADVQASYNPWGLTGYLTLEPGAPDVIVIEFGKGADALAKPLLEALSAANVPASRDPEESSGPPSVSLLIAPKSPPSPQ